jgi:hypothetical protein
MDIVTSELWGLRRLARIISRAQQEFHGENN